MTEIDTHENSSFLNYKLLREIQDVFKVCKSEVSLCNKKRDILRKFQKYFSFENIFKTRGVQGITGILKSKKCDKVVFKISIDLDKSIEHENLVTCELNKLRDFCPHFVGNIGMISLPIANDFINYPEKEQLFKNTNDYFPCNMLLLEYISPISLYHVCKYLYKEKSVIISQLCQIMMALDIAQYKTKFTHYDLHLDNVLIRQCDPDVLFLYHHKGKNILIPTYGLYPVIIDMGSSYCKSIEGNPMYTSSENYENGLQPTLYDNLNDIHHLLTSVLYYLEDKGYVYDYLRTYFLFLFKNLPVLSHKGWKQLPHDIMDLVICKIKADCPRIKSYKVYKNIGDKIISILNSLIILPWTENENLTFDKCVYNFFDEIQKIYDMKSVDSEEMIYILGETVELINNYRNNYFHQDDKSRIIKQFEESWKNKISFITKGELPKNINFESLFVNAINFADKISYNYYNYTRDHVEIINESYIKTNIKSPLDITNILLKNATPTYTLTKNNKIYIWNTEDESKRVIDVDGSLTKDQINNINNASIKIKGDLVYKYLNI